MNRIHQTITCFIAGIAAAFLVFSQLSFRDDATRNARTERLMPYQWKVPSIPETASFAGEAVPLERWDVREAYDRELLYNYYQQQHIMYIMKLAARYFPMIEERLRANGVPDDFKYLCVAESNIQNLTSRAGAKGFWQFMPDTAPAYDMVVNDDVDERYHVRKATDAACRYLKQAKNKFGSWTAAAASYNCGMGGYQAQANYQGSNHYYDLMLPEETNRYIFRILAFKQLLSNAPAYGYLLEEDQLYKPVQTRAVKVTQRIDDLAQFARQQGTTYRMLKMLNPWIRGRKLPVPAGGSYVIDLPAQ